MTGTSVLVDTNILFSGIVFSGPEARLLDLARSGRILLLIPDYVVVELRHVVSRKMPACCGILEAFLNEDYIVKLHPPSAGTMREDTS